MDLYGGEMGDRWSKIAELWQRYDALHLSSFADMHTVMAYAATAAK